MAFGLNSDTAAQAMLDGLQDRIRSDLRARILERIEPDITAAVDAACEALKIAIHAYADPMHMQHVVKVLVEHR